MRREQAVGWGFVAVQALLLVALILTPDGDLWPVTGAIGTIGTVLNVAGFGLIGWAVISFGAGVTPSPVPSKRATLVSSGPFRWIRHPMYTAVMAIGVGIALRTASWPAIALFGALVMFFNVKARWEERRLAEAYEGYASYQKGAGRFLPRFGRNVAP